MKKTNSEEGLRNATTISDSGNLSDGTIAGKFDDIESELKSSGLYSKVTHSS